MNKLQEIYDGEFNIQLKWFWGQGVRADIGDDANGWQNTGYFDTVDQAINWLWDKTVGKTKKPSQELEPLEINEQSR